MYTLGVGYMSDDARVLVGGMGISALGWDVSPALAVLALVARDHIDRLLEQIEIEVAVYCLPLPAEILVDVVLSACIEEGVDIRLVPAGLFDWLKLAIEVVEPLANIPLVGL